MRDAHTSSVSSTTSASSRQANNIYQLEVGFFP